MSDFRLLQKVFSALGEAREGSAALDVRISVALGDLQSGSAKLLRLFVEEGYDWAVISNLLDEQVLPYTTSLDASVPGENIVGVLYSRKRERWAAIHRAADGREEGPVWAATEALARRAAGLAGPLSQQRVVPDQEAPTGVPEKPPRESSAEPSAPGGAETEAEDELPDWKILF
jgi:hypothetical protein